MIVGGFYGGFFVIGVPIAGVYLIYLYRDKMQHRFMRSTFGFLFEGYRPAMFFWEFVVLLRKVVILAVALFWQDPFLQCIAGLFVLMISIVVHMACQPYEERFLNITELGTLGSLFTVVALSALLWYVQPRSNVVEVYEAAASAILFTMYSSLAVSLVGRYIYLEIRERSAAAVRLADWMRPQLEKIVRLERWVQWNVSGGRTPLLPLEESANAEWSFLRPVIDDEAVDEEYAIKESKIELLQRLMRRRQSGADQPQTGGGGGLVAGAAAACETTNPYEHAMAARRRAALAELGGVEGTDGEPLERVVVGDDEGNEWAEGENAI